MDFMKSIACYILHYGSEYLAWSIRSVQDAVDEILILYTDQPSHGQATNLKCPDTQEQLYKEAYRFLKKPLTWMCGRWAHEGLHRDQLMREAKDRGADVMVIVDADELWETQTLKDSIKVMAAQDRKMVRVRFMHFWKSFYFVCVDPCMPTRLINMHGDGEWYLSPQAHPVYHFGYCQPDEVIKYKMDIHGHKNEWRSCWHKDKWLNWTPGVTDVHPTCEQGFWTPKPTPADDYGIAIDKLLFDHPKRDVEI